MMRAKCPNCHAAYSIKPEFIGKQTVCRECGQIFTIYEDRPELPQPPPEQPGWPSQAQNQFPPASGQSLNDLYYGSQQAPPAQTAPPQTQIPSPPPRTQAQTSLRKEPKAEPVSRRPVSASSGSRVFSNILALLLVAAALGGGFFYFANQKSQQETAGLKAQLDRYQNPRLQQIRDDRPLIAEMLAQETEDIKNYPSEVPMHILKTAVISELRLTDALLTKEQAAIISGAPVDIKVNKQPPDPELAKNLESELQKLTDFINQRTEAKASLTGDAAIALESELGTLHLIKAVVIRNYLTAKYGLSSVFAGQEARSVPIQTSVQPSPGAASETSQASPGAGNTTAPAGPEAAAVQAENPATRKIQTVADLLGSSSDWKIQGPWATRMSGSGSGLSVRVLRLAAVNHAEINGVPQQASLFVNCQADKTEMMVMFSLPLAVNPNNKVDVEYQINEGDLVKEVWNAIPDQMGIFPPRPIPLLRDMIKARKIGFRVDYQSREHKIETFFELDGLTEAIKPIQSACNWK